MARSGGLGIIVIIALAGVAVLIGVFSFGLFNMPTDSDLVGSRVLIKSIDVNNNACRFGGATGEIISANIIAGDTFYTVNFDMSQNGVNSAAYSLSGDCVLFL